MTEGNYSEIVDDEMQLLVHDAAVAPSYSQKEIQQNIPSVRLVSQGFQNKNNKGVKFNYQNKFT